MIVYDLIYQQAALTEHGTYGFWHDIGRTLGLYRTIAGAQRDAEIHAKAELAWTDNGMKAEYKPNERDGKRYIIRPTVVKE